MNGPGCDVHYETLDARVRDAAQCEGWCLMCNTISAIKASREFWDDLARKGEARTTYDAKRNYGNRLDARRYVATLKVDTHCPGCDLKCTELNVEGFVHAHFADTAHLKHQGTRCQDSGMSGIVNKANSFKTTKPKIDYEHSITRVMCANCHKLDDTDNGI